MPSVQHVPLAPGESEKFGIHEDGCRFCGLDKSVWGSSPDCKDSDPMVRGARGYETREEKDPWEGGGSRVFEPWMMGPDDSRYGRALRRLSVVDLVGVIRNLEDDQKSAFVELLRSSEIPGVEL